MTIHRVSRRVTNSCWALNWAREYTGTWMHQLHRLKEEVVQSSVPWFVSWALGDLCSVLCCLLCIFSLHLSSSAVKHQDSNASLLQGHLRRLRIIKAEPQIPAMDRTPKKWSRLFPTALLICSMILVISLCPFFFSLHLLRKQRWESCTSPPLLNDLRTFITSTVITTKVFFSS